MVSIVYVALMIESCTQCNTVQTCSLFLLAGAMPLIYHYRHLFTVNSYLIIPTDEGFFRMRGQKYDYKIKYDDISRLFLLPKPDDVHMAFVIALDKPIRQGQQRYQYLVLQTNKDPDEVRVNLDEDTLKREYGDDLQPIMRGSLSNLVAKTLVSILLL